MSELLQGDWQCSECGHCVHEPESRLCPECRQGELCYMATEEELLHAEIDALRSENERLREALEGIKAWWDEDNTVGIKALKMMYIATEALEVKE